MANLGVTRWDRFLIGLAPDWGLRRVKARATAQLIARHFEAAQGSRRTSGWQRSASDANVANQPALAILRELSRDLRRNNGWAKRGVQAIVNNTVGWGILPKPDDHSRASSVQALEIWNEWACSTACDYDGRLNFYGLQRLAMETIAESGEVLIVRQPAATVDGLPIPLRLQVLEPDYIDTTRNGIVGADGGPTYQGIEFDRFGRRVAYWMFTSHPGGLRLQTTQFYSVRVPADRVIHIYRVDRPGQIRGVPWLASAIARLKDFDDYEDAELMQQKVAACFSAFVTDMDGATSALGEEGTDDDGQPIEQLEPGHIEYLPPGKTVTFATPPRVQDGAFTTRALRRIAVSLGVPYEELSGDYSQVNFSSARMARLAHWQNVSEWREHMLIPQLCGGVWRWAMELVVGMYGGQAVPCAQWAAPPMPILEPDKEGLAYQRLVRIGAMTWSQMIRELGYDPVAQLDEIERLNQDLDRRGILLDSDPRRATAAGGVQQVWSQGSIGLWPPVKGGANTSATGNGKAVGAGQGGGAGDDTGDETPAESA
jgi:lambda family phage portal protein